MAKSVSSWHKWAVIVSLVVVCFGIGYLVGHLAKMLF